MITPVLALYRKAYAGLNTRIWLLSLVMLINRSGTMVLPYMTLYCIKSGYTVTQAGASVAVYGFGALCGAYLGGKISDKWGFHNVQLTSLFCGGIFFILLGQMNSFLTFCICTFFLSMVNESFRPANASAIAHYSTTTNRTQSFSLARLAVNIGWGVGSALGGILASINYHLLFWVDGCTNIAAAILLLFILPKAEANALAENKLAEEKKTYPIKSPLGDKVFLWFLLFQILFAVAFFQMFSTIPIFFHEKLKINEFWIGIIMSVNGLLIAFFEMILVFKLEGRHAYLRLIVFGALLMALSFFLLNMPLSNGFIIASLAVVIITFAEMIGMPFMNSFYISRSEQRNRGRYAGMYTMAWSTAQIIASYGGTVVAAALGYESLWWIVGGICLVSALGYFWLLSKT